MPRILDALKEFFSEDEWEYAVMEGKSVLRMGFSGDNGNWICYAQTREAQNQFMFYSLCPLNVPARKLQDMAEFLTRANYGIIVGNFELDYDDGEIRYKTSIDVEDAELSSMHIRHLVYANVTTLDRYLPGIMAVLAGSRTPREAIEDIDKEEAGDPSMS